MTLKKKIMSLVLSATLIMNVIGIYAGTISIDEAWDQLSSSQKSQFEQVGLDKNGLNKIDSMVGGVDISSLIAPPLTYEGDQFTVSQSNADQVLNMLNLVMDTDLDSENMLEIFNNVIGDINNNSSEKTRQDFAKLLGQYGMVNKGSTEALVPEGTGGGNNESLNQENIQEKLEEKLLALKEVGTLNKGQKANLQKILEILSSHVQEPLTLISTESLQQAWDISIQWQQNNAIGLKFAKANTPVARLKMAANTAVSIPKGLWDDHDVSQTGRLDLESGSALLSIDKNTYTNKATKVTLNSIQKDGYSQGVEMSSTSKMYSPAKLSFYTGGEVPEEYGIYKIEGDKIILIGGIYNEALGAVEALVKTSGTYVLKKTTPKAYKDLTDVKWAEKQINHLGQKGYIVGKSEGIYGPKDDITRAEFAVLLTRILRLPEANISNDFSDMKPDAWYYFDVLATVEAGLFNGKSEDNFDPAGKITRQEVAAVISRILVQKGYSEPKVDNIPKGTWAPGALALLKDQSLVTEIVGFNDQIGTNANRAEVAYILYNLLQR